MYTLVAPAPSHKDLPLGGKVGIGINAVLFIGVIIAVWIFVKRRKAKAAAARNARSTTFPAEEPALQMSQTPNTHELDSPEAQTKTPGTGDRNWPIFPTSLPPAYEHAKAKSVTNRLNSPQELPGSTFIYEHHPAFSSHDTPTEGVPPSPPKTPNQKSGKGSPVMSAITPKSVGTQSPPFVSPLGSPRLPQSSP